MEKEIIISKTALKNIYSPFIIEHILREGYKLTGNKFSINWNGSKGYFDHIEITCECDNSIDENRINRDDIFTSTGNIRKRTVNIFFSNINGVRVSFGKDSPKEITSPYEVVPCKATEDGYCIKDEQEYCAGNICEYEESSIEDTELNTDNLPF